MAGRWQLSPQLRTFRIEFTLKSGGTNVTVQSLRKQTVRAIVFLALLGSIPAAFTLMTFSEHQRRLNVLNGGQHVSATVFRSDDKGYKRLCLVQYSFQIGSIRSGGEVVSCDLMRRYPVGSALPVKYASNDPLNPLVQGETTWPAYWIAPVLLLPLWALIAGLIGFSLVKGAIAQTGKRKQQPRRNVR
jgi:hypothetical protein